jgi:cell division protein ZapE
MTDTAIMRYQALLQSSDLQLDQAQLSVLQYLDQMAIALRDTHKRRLFGLVVAKPQSVKGLYLWGKVGRGKTLLTELFLQSIPDIPHQRWHFHRFMNHVHQELALLPGTADTLAVLAKSISKNCRLLVLDEFFVSDIGDAMILYRLLDQLLINGVSFITTSNVFPDNLYLNGLQRESFLPCIALIKNECEVLELISAQDFRLRTLSHAATYFSPNNEESANFLKQQYQKLSGEKPVPDTIEINGRLIQALALSSGVAWFDFAALCDGPRSASDYIEIARDFHTVLISDVPQFNGENEEPARRFVYLIDELYDRHVNVLLSAEVEVTVLYQGKRLRGEFERTSSRLVEMQSKDYLALEHRP